MKKVALALSGGVDSATAAMLLLKKGYEVVGITYRLTDKTKGEIEDAKLVCDALGIEHRVLDYQDLFRKKVIDPFIDGYIAAQTPNPCVFCNKFIKFGAFFEYCLKEGFDFVSTGHYAQIKNDENGYHLIKAQNNKKDQSYILYGLKQSQLKNIIFPLGDLTIPKAELRKMAEKANIPVANRPESQDICFIRDGQYAEFIESKRQIKKKGCFIDIEGNPLGEHKGYYHYTIGQRKGLGISLGATAYVTAIDQITGNVTLSLNQNHLFCDSFFVKDFNLCRKEEPDFPLCCQVKMRYSATPVDAVVTKEDSILKVTLSEKGRAPTCGQAAVFYKGNEVLGGGTIFFKV